MTPLVRALAGRFVVAETGAVGNIERAKRIDYPDRRVVFTAEYEDSDERWELRVESDEGRTFSGAMTSPDWDRACAVKMTLWVAPDDENEWLLVGAWTDEEEGRIEWSIHLFVDEDEE